MATGGTIFTTLFMGLVSVAVLVNFIVVPMFDDIKQQVGNQTQYEYNNVGVGIVDKTNATGNDTASYNVTRVGLFGDPKTQLTTVLIILGVSAGVAAVAIFGTGAQPGPAAVVAFIVALALVLVNTLAAMFDTLSTIPYSIGTAIFIFLVGLVMLSTLMVAAGIMSGSGNQ